MPRWVWWLIGIFVIFLIVTNPTSAANMFVALGHGLGHVASAFGTFFSKLVSGF